MQYTLLAVFQQKQNRSTIKHWNGLKKTGIALIVFVAILIVLGLFIGLLVVGCQPDSKSEVDSRIQSITYLPYNQVYGIATHNSYFINRSDQTDYGASGTQELLTDQLLH